MDNTASRKRIDENMTAEVLHLVRCGWDLRIILSQLKPKYPSLSRDGIRIMIKANDLKSIKKEVGKPSELPILR